MWYESNTTKITFYSQGLKQYKLYIGKIGVLIINVSIINGGTNTYYLSPNEIQCEMTLSLMNPSQKC